MFTTLFNFVLKPRSTINRIMQERNLRLALLGYCVGAFSLTLSSMLRDGQNNPFIFIAIFLAALFFNVCISFFFSATAHLFLELTTGRGRAAGLFVLIGLSEFTKTLLVAFTLIALNLPFLFAYKTLITIIVSVIQLFLILFMMQHAYGLSKKRTFFALLISFVPAIICFFATIFMLIGLLVWLIAS